MINFWNMPQEWANFRAQNVSFPPLVPTLFLETECIKFIPTLKSKMLVWLFFNTFLFSKYHWDEYFWLANMNYELGMQVNVAQLLAITHDLTSQLVQCSEFNRFLIIHDDHFGLFLLFVLVKLGGKKILAY